MTTYKQATGAPTRKMKSVMIGGAVASVSMGVVNAVSPEIYQSLMQPGFEAGLAVIIASVAGWFVEEGV
jgi:hypothetical protein